MSHPGKVELTAVNETIAALFDALSFEPGHQPNISAINNLFVEGGLLINCNEHAPQTFQVGQFIEHFQSLFKQQQITSLHETEVHHKTKVYDHIAHRYSFYEARTAPDTAPFAVGINTIQLIKTNEGWKITSMAWNDDHRGDGFFERTIACINQ